MRTKPTACIRKVKLGNEHGPPARIGARDVPARSTFVCPTGAGKEYANSNTTQAAAGRDVPRSDRIFSLGVLASAWNVITMIKSCWALSLISLLLYASTVEAADGQGKPRLVVLTDVSNEPDDEESLVRLLVYANEYDLEGLIATTSTHLKQGPREDILRRDIDAYEKVLPNLRQHAPDYPSAQHLRSIIRTGQSEFGMAGVGDGKTTPGSQLLITAAERPDARPLWISIWGGANTLAQALHDARATREPHQFAQLVAKLRVYAISDQDDAGHWLRPEFSNLFYIVSPSNVGGGEYWRATWTGISGDRRNKTGVMHRFAMVDNPWLEKNIIQDHGALGALYPRLAFIMEGDTPSFLGLINNGLGWHVQPDYGGWGGRYAFYKAYGEARAIWTDSRDSRDTVTSDDNGRTETSHQATLWRWREHFQNDFAARMDWCVADDFKKANHNPIVVLNGDKTKNVIEIPAKQGETVRLTAEGTSDPDGNRINLRWWIYREAGSMREETSLSMTSGTKTSLVLPEVKKAATLHVILEARDDGAPPLWAYRRAVIKIQP
jgi:hypothetical protein